MNMAGITAETSPCAGSGLQPEPKHFFFYHKCESAKTSGAGFKPAPV